MSDQNFAEAERHLAILADETDPEAWAEAFRDGQLALGMQAAQVHATLSVGASLADIGRLLTEIRDEIAALSPSGRTP